MSKWRSMKPHEKAELLAKLWKPGVLATTLAEETSKFLGEEVTRNSIIGVYHRSRANARTKGEPDPLFLCPLSTPLEGQRRRRAKNEAKATAKTKGKIKANGKTAVKKKPVKAKRAEPDPGPQFKLEPLPEPEPDLIGMKYISFHKLTDATCRWPTNERDEITWRFCGKQTAPGSSYCPYHDKKSQGNAAEHAEIPFIVLRRWKTSVHVR